MISLVVSDTSEQGFRRMLTASAFRWVYKSRTSRAIPEGTCAPSISFPESSLFLSRGRNIWITVNITTVTRWFFKLPVVTTLQPLNMHLLNIIYFKETGSITEAEIQRKRKNSHRYNFFFGSSQSLNSVSISCPHKNLK